MVSCVFYGAGDEARTRYLHLGKVALYRMSYTRGTKLIITDFTEMSILIFAKFKKFFRSAVMGRRGRRLLPQFYILHFALCIFIRFSFFFGKDVIY